MKQYLGPETVTLDWGIASIALTFEGSLAVISLLEQDQSGWQIECQNRAREGLSRACECSRGLPLSQSSGILQISADGYPSLICRTRRYGT